MHPQIVPSDSAVDAVACDVLAVGAYAGAAEPELGTAASKVDRTLEGQLSDHLQTSGFKGKLGDVALVPSLGRLPARTIAVVGLGDRPSVDAGAVRRAAGIAARRLQDSATISSALEEGATHAAAAAEGFLLGSYRFTRYKSDPRPSKIQRIMLLGETDVGSLERAQAVAEATVLARDLTNEPPSVIYPETLAAKAEEIADVAGLEATIYDEEQLHERGFGGILAVGRGSVRPPRLIQLRYAPEGAAAKVALLGKGITFDSGGLSIKDAKSMETMKTDMAGAAAVLGAMSAIGRLRPNVEVLALVPSSENMPGGRAIKPGDVIEHYGGRTSEVLNTDAEGRLVLADALALASEERPDAIVDVATLTGGIMVALGRKAAGLFANDDALRAEIEDAARRAGERVWAMPMYDDYRSELDSEIADIKNTGGRYGSSIFGALFLRDFVASGIPWAHLDIAGAARAESDYDEVPKGGTGASTRTLISFVEARAT